MSEQQSAGSIVWKNNSLSPDPFSSAWNWVYIGRMPDIFFRADAATLLAQLKLTLARDDQLATNAALAQIADALRQQHAKTAEAIAAMIENMPEKPDHTTLVDLIRDAVAPGTRVLKSAT